MRAKSFLEIQKEIIENYKIVIVENSTCKSRMHTHCDGTRRICKWQPKNSIVATFDLLHEVGHIMTTTSKMRRVEAEFYATIWAIERCKEYGLEIPTLILNRYQKYIDMELDRGLRRGGANYRNDYNIKIYNPKEIIELPIKEPKEVKIKKRRINILGD